MTTDNCFFTQSDRPRQVGSVRSRIDFIFITSINCEESTERGGGKEARKEERKEAQKKGRIEIQKERGFQGRTKERKVGRKGTCNLINEIFLRVLQSLDSVFSCESNLRVSTYTVCTREHTCLPKNLPFMMFVAMVSCNVAVSQRSCLRVSEKKIKTELVATERCEDLSS